METMHLYWIFIGPSFAVYAKYDVTLKHTLQWVYMLIHLFENAFTFLQLPVALIHTIDCRAGSGVLTCSNHSQHVYRRSTALILYFFKYFTSNILIGTTWELQLQFCSTHFLFSMPGWALRNGQPPPPRNRCPPVHLCAISVVILASQKINFSA